MGERSISGPDLIRDSSGKVGLIRKRLLTTQIQKKSYADRLCRPLEFKVGDHVFLKVMPKSGVVRVAYRLALPPSMSGVHEVFHGSILQKYTLNPAHVVD